MKKHKAAMATAAVCLTLLTAGCATGPDRKPEDPFEPANRVIFKFNDKLDRTVAQPVARGYQKVTPQPLREAISSFFSNISDLSNLANSVLQLKITEATETLMRIVINSTFGVGGMFDVATVAGLQKHPEDFGLTLGHYGAPAGPYIVLPVFGPSSVRDGIGMGVDVKFNLLNYIEPAARNPLYITQFVSVRSDMLGATDLLKQAALDPYSFVRDAYRQQREARVLGRSGASAPPPDYGDPGESGGGNAGTPGAAGESPAVPNYSDPGETGGSGTSNGSAPGATGTSPSVPDYSDPGETGGSNGGTQPATGAAAGTGGAGAAAAAGTVGVGAAAATGASGAAGTAGVVATPQPAADKAGAATTPQPATDKTGTATTPQPATGITGTTTAPQPAANPAGAAESQATPASAAPAAASAPSAASDPAAAPAQPASGTAEPQSSPGPAAH